jgi:thioredoxin 1
MAERLNGETFKEKAFQPGKLTLIDFYSDSCVPCKRMVPVFAKLEEKYGDQIYIGKVNVAYEQELMSAPTLIFLKDGEQIEKLTGAKKAADLEEIIDKNL